MIPDDQIRFFTGMFVTIPLSFALRYIPSYTVRMYYSLVLSIILQFYTYGIPSCLPLALHVFMYYLIKNVKRQHCGYYAIVVSMVLVSLYYIYAMIVDYGRFQLDISTTLMMSICKYSLFAFSYQDGLQINKLQNKQQAQQKISILPSFFHYFNYMVFLPTCLINTPFSYKIFEDYMKKENQFSSIPLNGVLRKFGKQFVILILCFAAYAFSITYFPTNAMRQDNYLDQGVFHHIWYSYVSLNLYATRFFSGFILMQLPVHASGVSYKPTPIVVDDQFQGIKTIKIYEFEAAYHLRDKIASWNMAVQEWLRKCVYQRLPYKKQKSQLITLMVSALWHGFYPGLYLTFGFYFLQIYTGNIIYKFSCNHQEHPIIQFYKRTEKYSFYVCWLVWNWLFVTNSAYFVVLNISRSYELLSAMKFGNPIFLVVLVIFFKLISSKSKQKSKNM